METRGQNQAPRTPAPPALGSLHFAGAPGGCVHAQGRQVAVGRLAARSRSPAQPPPAPSHKDPGLAQVRQRVAFRGASPPWLLLSTIPAASALRGASKAELFSQLPSGETGRYERAASFMAIPSLEKCTAHSNPATREFLTTQGNAHSTVLGAALRLRQDHSDVQNMCA